MNKMRQIPNLFTLGNLFCGCVAIVYVLQDGLVPLYQQQELLWLPDINAVGSQYVNVPEKIFMASVFIFIAAIIDFLDGFLARLLGADSEMGKQLDSLADVVSFGVAPGLIIYQFLRLAFAQQDDGLTIPQMYLIPAFIFPCAGAWRLARFNTAPSSLKTTHFEGVPIPAAGLVVASLPLIYWTTSIPAITRLFINPSYWYMLILFLSGLMVSRWKMLALKFSGGISFGIMLPFLLILVLAILAGYFWQWVAIPIVFLFYVLLSLFTLKKEKE
jgi:CDP-diacylglycerol--serine O-phosphatidyltransferase